MHNVENKTEEEYTENEIVYRFSMETLNNIKTTGNIFSVYYRHMLRDNLNIGRIS